MSPLQWVLIVISHAVVFTALALLGRSLAHYVDVFKLGTPEHHRRDNKWQRTVTLLREFFLHTRMKRLPLVAAAHWFVAIGFLVLVLTLLHAFGELFDPRFALPVIGHWPPYEWAVEIMAWATFWGIVVLIFIRQKNKPANSPGIDGRRSRFFGSTFWQAYFVEFIILAVSTCIISIRGLEWVADDPENRTFAHYPTTGLIIGKVMENWFGHNIDLVLNLLIIVAALKIIISFTWMIIIARFPTMGVAWHRFLAFANIWLKRHADGRTSLGALHPLLSNGEPIDFENADDLDENTVLGVRRIEDFTWKGLLDFTTCTECGRCQSQCPAWNTDKPLSPKLLIMNLREHAHAKAPWMQATEEERKAMPAQIQHLDEMPLVGDTGYDIEHPLTAYTPLGPDCVIDSDVLWSCTTCGACVEQCPVDIEHVDHIVDMRRYQTMIETAYPSEFAGLFKNLEQKQNPWGMASKLRMDWAKGLDFDIPLAGADVEDLSDVDYLYWVGCAGAFEDRAKRTARAVAELLHTAGVTFAVLGDGETCTGDSARRAGNEFLFHMLAQGNVEMFKELKVTKIIVTCPHCFNTFKNEYPQLGGHYEVVHHTELLNDLVKAGRLTPVTRPNGPMAKGNASTAPSVTYHDPCYLGRHNHVYAPPRELLGSLPGVTMTEMDRSGIRSFCCGAGGARMWAEEKLGTRININRTEEAIATGVERIAVACPFCRVMISDGVNAKREGGIGQNVEVVDVAQMLLAAIQPAPPAEPVAVAAAPASDPEPSAPAPV